MEHIKRYEIDFSARGYFEAVISDNMTPEEENELIWQAIHEGRLHLTYTTLHKAKVVAIDGEKVNRVRRKK